MWQYNSACVIGVVGIMLIVGDVVVAAAVVVSGGGGGGAVVLAVVVVVFVVVVFIDVFVLDVVVSSQLSTRKDKFWMSRA